MEESKIERQVREMVRQSGGLCLKWVSPGFSGVPDRIILLPGGRILFAELKAPGKKARPRQERVHGQLRDLGFGVMVIDDPDQLREVIDGV